MEAIKQKKLIYHTPTKEEDDLFNLFTPIHTIDGESFNPINSRQSFINEYLHMYEMDILDINPDELTKNKNKYYYDGIPIKRLNNKLNRPFFTIKFTKDHIFKDDIIINFYLYNNDDNTRSNVLIFFYIDTIINNITYNYNDLKNKIGSLCDMYVDENDNFVFTKRTQLEDEQGIKLNNILCKLLQL